MSIGPKRQCRPRFAVAYRLELKLADPASFNVGQDTQRVISSEKSPATVLTQSCFWRDLI
jgi:hypothetical protein